MPRRIKEDIAEGHDHHSLQLTHNLEKKSVVGGVMTVMVKKASPRKVKKNIPVEIVVICGNSLFDLLGMTLT